MNKLKKFLFSCLICSVVCFIPKTRAETIPIKDGTFGVSYGGSYAIPTNTFSIQGGTTTSKELYLYNYEGYSRPYTYVVLEFCSGNVDLIRNAYISNANFVGNWINDGKGVTYVTTDTCTNASYTGYVIKKQFQIGKYEDMDGTGEELVASAYLNIKSNLSYYSWFRLSNVYLSSDDELSVLAQNQKDTQDLISKIEQSSTSIVQSQEQVKQKLDSLNSSIGQTNDKLDSVNSNLNNVNTSIKDTQDYLKDDTAPSADINVLGNVQGILPEGPIDSLLNIPFKVLSILNSSFGGVCVPISGKFVFDSTLTIPCFSDLFYSNVPDSIMIFINVVPTAFILIAYLKNLYKRVDRAMSLETSADDEWGGI